jgi:hypothetical protein
MGDYIQRCLQIAQAGDADGLAQQLDKFAQALQQPGARREWRASLGCSLAGVLWVAIVQGKRGGSWASQDWGVQGAAV